MKILCGIVAFFLILSFIGMIWYLSHLSNQLEKLRENKPYDFWEDTFRRVWSIWGIFNITSVFFDIKKYSTTNLQELKKRKNKFVAIFYIQIAINMAACILAEKFCLC